MATFAELIDTLKNSEDALEQELNWEELLGNVADKVDSIKFITDRLKFEIGWIENEMDALQKRHRSLVANLGNLKKYVNWALYSADFEQVPGNKWIVYRQKNPVTVDCQLVADADTWQKWEKYVRRRVEYSWKKDDLKQDYDILPEDLKRAVSKIQDTHIRFKAKKD